MTGHILPIRPARAAIAAVLAFSATPLLAQTAAPPVVPTIVPPVQAVTPAPVTTAPDTAVFAPSAPVVQATPPVEERIAAARAAAEAETPRAVAPDRSATAPRAGRSSTASTSARTTAPATRAPETQAAAPASSAMPAPAAVEAPAQAPIAEQSVPAEPAAPAPVANDTVNDTAGDNALLWALGGGALLLMGIGGAALARRRRPERDAVVTTAEPVAVADPYPVAPAPVMDRAPARPAMAAAPVGENGSLAAMVAAPPSAENPFRTRKNRMRRARWLIAQRDDAAAPATPPQTFHAEPVPASAADRSQTVYSFGRQDARKPIFRPRTT
ncbi:hypothetical protein J3E64_003255 [Sphingobium sp. OAS761]|uniref:hypothetical protein n=1 Tax=Sphingobium sp. OAS761 TaxID=2817901 RepID=UPI00209F8DA3|nr:hypothetical protein [Sphingobium sp. OAS761]MCP1471544.1 hypothetical protein [Sphingobium sp. OAS761]